MALDRHREVTPAEWGRGFASPPDLCSASTGWKNASLRRWRGTSAEMKQPPLDHHCIVMHLGGAKRVTRRREGPTLTAEAGSRAITTIPAGTTSDWSTAGPIGFAHLYVHPHRFDRCLQEQFDRDPRGVALTDAVGTESPLLHALFQGMVNQVETPGAAQRLVLDTLLQSFIVQLICERSTIGAATRPAPHSLAPRRLKRVIDFIEANLADEIALDDLASVAGSSRYHFSRAFRDATGLPPYRYLVHRRIDAAKAMLLSGDLPIDEIAAQCGFKSVAQFSVMFKQVFGTTPGRFRREHRNKKQY